MARGKSSITKTLVWGLLILVVMGFGAFGTVSFSGGVRGLGDVGQTEITSDAYARTLQNEMQALQAQTGQPVTMAQAQQWGVTDRALAQVVTSAALDEEARRIGLSVGDAQVAEELAAISAFQGPDGSFSRDGYAMALRNAGLSEAEFEEDLRRESARSLLTGAILSGTALPDTYVDTLLAWAGETRNFTWARLGRDSLTTGLPVPTEADLQAWYEENIDLFTLPEAKALTYAWITPDMILDTVEVDEDTLRAAYEERIAEYNLPERRLVERLVFGNEAEAQAALDRITAGETDFETVVDERGLALSDIDLGDLPEGALDEAGAAVFAAEVGQVVGPLPSDLGPALYRVNGVLEAQETPYEDAVPQLRDELALDRARRVIAGMAQSLDDELAGGATLEDLAEETELDLGQIDWTEASDSGIAGYDAFREAAAAITAEDYPEIRDLGDGGIFALRLDEIRPPAPQPFDAVRDQVGQGYDAEQATEALLAQARTLADRIAAGESFADLGLEPVTEEGLTRDARIEGLPDALLPEAFTLEPGTTATLPGDGSALILRLDAVTPVDRTTPEAEALAGLLRDRAASAVANDLYRAFTTDIQNRAGVRIDQQAVTAVHTSFQ
ncbi:peptidyl-prolyl cis-trans isomerase [Salipiger marinus]|uniref:Parvulin-like PPIase n=1 Tax=Salipiger marinus TaxID=555512 RepID=A0A1G8N6H5_9RHOB|nr:peptidyl-prolyl cis-trans isomerase [Salipiger marinus]SDI75743.1 peptidyl-prolyl cis-trans isomerase D [Salipiger marinus]